MGMVGKGTHIVRILRAIGERHATLRDGGLVLQSASGDVEADAKAVSSMVSEGLLARVRNKVARTDAGRTYLRRVLSGAGDATTQHRLPVQRTVKSGTKTFTVIENAIDSPLAWLAQRKDKQGNTIISLLQRQAGERLFQDHERGHQSPRVTASWDPSGVRGGRRRDGLSVSEAVHEARRRVESALAAVGPGLSDTLIAVCCEGIGLEALEKRFGWPARSGKVVLRLALDRLAAHYGLSTTAEGKGPSGIVQWGTPDFRPSA